MEKLKALDDRKLSKLDDMYQMQRIFHNYLQARKNMKITIENKMQ